MRRSCDCYFQCFWDTCCSGGSATKYNQVSGELNCNMLSLGLIVAAWRCAVGAGCSPYFPFSRKYRLLYWIFSSSGMWWLLSPKIGYVWLLTQCLTICYHHQIFSSLFFSASLWNPKCHTVLGLLGLQPMGLTQCKAMIGVIRKSVFLKFLIILQVLLGISLDSFVRIRFFCTLAGGVVTYSSQLCGQTQGRVWMMIIWW